MKFAKFSYPFFFFALILFIAVPGIYAEETDGGAASEPLASSGSPGQNGMQANRNGDPERKSRVYVEYGAASWHPGALQMAGELKNINLYPYLLRGQGSIGTDLNNLHTRASVFALGISWKSKGGGHRGNLSLNYMGTGNANAYTAEQQSSTSTIFGMTSSTSARNFTFNDGVAARRVNLRYDHEIYPLKSLIPFISHLGVRVGIDTRGDLVKKSGYMYTNSTSSGITSTQYSGLYAEQTVNYNQYFLNGILGLIYRIEPIANHTFEVGVDYHRSLVGGSSFKESVDGSIRVFLNPAAISDITQLMTAGKKSSTISASNAMEGRTYLFGYTFAITSWFAIKVKYAYMHGGERIESVTKSSAGKVDANDLFAYTYTNDLTPILLKSMEIYGPLPGAQDRSQAYSVAVQFRW